MLTLMLLRHAKAAQGGQEDFARELSEAGRGDAAALGDFLSGRIPHVDQALVSSALRTRETYEIVRSRTGWRVEAHFDNQLYDAPAERLVESLRSCTGAVTLLVGHNPGIMDAAAALARDGDIAELQRMRSRFPPCALAVLTFQEESWAEAVSASAGRLDLFSSPETLRC